MSYILRRIMFWGVAASLLGVRATHAQITTDGSVGAGLALSGPDFQIPSDLGQIRGRNLFHSFSDFNLSVGEAATFSGPGSISNILARVTGGGFSSIDGALNSSIAGANFFFINPSGILFGPNAQVNVSGSFVATTADAVRLQDGGVFDAQNPSASTLTSAPVSAFGFLGPRPASIFLQGAQLGVLAEKSFSLIGGRMVLDSAGLFASKGQVNLVSVGSPGEVTLETSSPQSTPQLQGFEQGGSIEMSGALVGVADHGNGASDVGGSVHVRGDSLAMDGTTIFSQNSGSTSGGLIDIGLNGNLQMTNGAAVLASTRGGGSGAGINLSANAIALDNGAYLNTLGFAAGQGGNIAVSAGQLQLQNGGQIVANSLGTGNGGDISLAAGSVILDGTGQTSLTSVFTTTGGSGTGGNINAQVGSLKIANGAQLSTGTSSEGVGGNINLSANDITLDGGNSPFLTAVQAQTFGSGQGGSINVAAKNVDVLRGAYFYSGNEGSGAGGNLSITAEKIGLDGQGLGGFTGIFANSLSAIQGGKAGDIQIVAKDLQVLRGSLIDATTYGDGKAGNIEVKADNILLDQGGTRSRTGISAESLATQGGNSGSISIDAATFNVLGGADVNASTRGGGNGGNIAVNVDEILLSGNSGARSSGIIADTLGARGAGNGGSINIKSRNLQIFDGARISATTAGDGNRAGSGNIAKIDINSDRVVIDGQGNADFTGVVAQTTALSDGGQGGSINLTAKTLQILNRGQVSTLTAGDGASGAISITVDDVTVDGKGIAAPTGISAQSLGAINGGRGGDIELKARTLRILNGGVISATTIGSGDGGKINITADNITTNRQNSPQFTGIAAQTQFAGDGAGKGGDIRLNAQDLKVLNGSQISATTTGSGAGGTITVNANKVVLDAQNSPVATGIVAGTSAFLAGNPVGDRNRGGDISVAARELQILRGALISATTDGSGNGGGIRVSADQIILNGSASGTGAASSIDAGSSTGSTGQGGNILLQTKDLQILDHSDVTSTTFGSGDGGKIVIEADKITVDGRQNPSFTGISAQTRSQDNGGRGGDIELKARELQILSGGAVSATTLGNGDGGKINIVADTIKTNGEGNSRFTGILAQTLATGGGQGGNIDLTTKNLQILNGSIISATTAGGGAGGKINISADSVTLNGSGTTGLTGIGAQTTLENGGGNGGDIRIATKTLEVTDGAAIRTNTRGSGNGGSVSIAAEGVTLLQKGEITARSEPTSSTVPGGNGGNIELKTQTLQLSSGSSISASSLAGGGTGGSIVIEALDKVTMNSGASIAAAAATSDGGNVLVNAGDSITLNESQISSSAGKNGGNITLNAARLIHLRNSSLKAIATGNGGNISIDPRFVIFDNSQIQADAINGNGGNINIRANVFIPSSDSLISASSQFGVAGNILISAPNPNIGSSLVRLPTNPLSAEDQLEEICLLRRGRTSSFIVGRLGRAAPNPFGITPSLGAK